MRKIFRRLIPYEEALGIILQSPPPKRRVRVPLGEALGHLSGEDVLAGIDAPPFSRSEMDGYALKSIDVVGADETTPIALRIVARLKAEEIFQGFLERGEAIEVATGSPLPHGADAVVPVEYTGERDGEVFIYRSVGSFENVLEAGRDFQAGELLFGEGERLSSPHVSALAAMGRDWVMVYGKPILGILSTGGEVTAPGEPLAPGRIYDINASSLYTQALEAGALPRFYGIAPDDLGEMRRIVGEMMEECDIIVLSGGSSSGEGDLAYRLLEDLGPSISFHGVQIRPGKPTGFGLIRGKPFFILAGNPVSSHIGFNQFIKPLLEAWVGSYRYGRVRAKLAIRYFPARGRREILPVTLIGDREFLAYPLHGSSGAVSRLLRADGYLDIPAHVDILMEGEEVEVQFFPHAHPSGDAIFGYIDPPIQLAAWKTFTQYGRRVKLVKEGLEQALKSAGRTSSLLSLATPEGEKPGLGDGWEALTGYYKAFGLSLKEGLSLPGEGRDLGKLRLAGRIPWSIEGKMAASILGERGMEEARILFFSSTDGEALSALGQGLVDGAFTYDTGRENFLELGRIRVTLYRPMKAPRERYEGLMEILTSKDFKERCRSLFPWIRFPRDS